MFEILCFVTSKLEVQVPEHVQKSARLQSSRSVGVLSFFPEAKGQILAELEHFQYHVVL